MLNCLLAFFMLIPLLWAAMAENNCSFVQFPFFSNLEPLLTVGCLTRGCELAFALLGMPLAPTLNSNVGARGSIRVISSIGKFPVSKGLDENQPNLLLRVELLLAR